MHHDHEHGHSHDHCHDHDHCGEHQHCHGCSHDHTPQEEIVALMRYMVGHNTQHANELATLAANLKKLGDTTSYEQVMAAVSDFEKGNLRLSTVLASLDVK
ncbi:MAG: cobalt transporter [Eubacteriales bacterium]